MSVSIIGTRAKVHYLTDNRSATLTKDQGILYVCPKGLGQVTRNTAAGLTPAAVFEQRYSGSKSPMTVDFVADDIFVFDKIHGANYDYDDGCRELVNRLNRRGLVGFKANVKSVQVSGKNSEALIDYDPWLHRQQLVNVVKQYFGLSTHYNTHEPFQPRWGQQWAIDSIVTGLKNHNTVLFAGYTGIGKSKIALEAIHRHFSKGALVLITTPITETITSFKDAIDDTRFGDVPTRPTVIYSTDSMPDIKTIRQQVSSGQIVIVIATVQDIRYQDTGNSTIDKKIRTKYVKLSKMIDLWVRDEYHKEYGGAITREVFKNIATGKKLDLTATPYSVIDEYESEQIVSRTLMWAVANNNHTLVPNFGIDCLAGLLPKNMGKYNDIFTVAEGFHSHKLVEQNPTTGEFVNFGIIEDLIHRAYCRNQFSRDKNPFSIGNDTELSLLSREVGLWIMPEGANGITASEYIIALTDKLNASAQINSKVLVTSAYEIDRLRGTLTVEEYINTIVDDRVLVILTHGKFKTGTDIPRLGHVVLLDSISNIAEFEQTIGRIMRVYGRTGQRKDYTKMYVYSPGVTIKEVVARLAHENTRLPTDESRTELEFLSCFPISEYDGLTIKPLDSAQLFEEFRDRLRLHSAIVNFKLPSEIRSLVEGDQSILDSLALLAKRANRGNTKVGVTEENNSQVFADDGDQSDDNQNKSKNSVSQQRTIDQIINGLEEIWINVPPFAMIGESDRVIDVLTCEPLIDMFGEDKIYSVVSVLQTYPEFAKRLQNRLDIFLTAFKDLPPEDCYDIVFKNCERKMKQGLVFTPFDVANMHIDNIPMDEYNNKYGY